MKAPSDNLWKGKSSTHYRASIHPEEWEKRAERIREEKACTTYSFGWRVEPRAPLCGAAETESLVNSCSAM